MHAIANASFFPQPLCIEHSECSANAQLRTMPGTSTGSSSFEVLGEHSTCDGETVLEFVDENTADSHKKKGEGESRQGEAEAAPHTPKSLDDVVYALKELQVKLAEQSHFMGACTHKLSFIELRQSTTQGEGTDAVRAAHQWAVGDSALLSLKAVEVVAKDM